MVKVQLSEIFTADVAHKIRAPYLFHFKTLQILTTAILTGSASTIHNSLKIVFQNFTFWYYPGYDTCFIFQDIIGSKIASLKMSEKHISFTGL